MSFLPVLSAERVHLNYLLTLCVTSSAELLLSYKNNTQINSWHSCFLTKLRTLGSSIFFQSLICWICKQMQQQFVMLLLEMDKINLFITVSDGNTGGLSMTISRVISLLQMHQISFTWQLFFCLGQHLANQWFCSSVLQSNTCTEVRKIQYTFSHKADFYRNMSKLRTSAKKLLPEFYVKTDREP